MSIMKNYSAINESFSDAKEMYEFGKAKLSLVSVRTFIEGVVKEMCNKAQIETTASDGTNIDLISLIDCLREMNILTETEAGIFHRLRLLGNKGAHISEDLPTMHDAEEAVSLIGEAKVIFERIMESGDLDSIAKNNNRPMEFPDYYSPSRSVYYGKWAHCKSKNDLLIIPEYVKLKQRADVGDIGAMLDIAAGFLDGKLNFSDDGLVCLPPYVGQGQTISNSEAYDARYFACIADIATEVYWITSKGFDFSNISADMPLKYIATALLEYAKFCYYLIADSTGTFRVTYWVSSYDIQRVRDKKQVASQSLLNRILVDTSDEVGNNYENQYEWAEDMFGEFSQGCNLEVMKAAIRTLIYLMETYPGQIIAPVHKQQTIGDIKFLGYCIYCYNANHLKNKKDCQNDVEKIREETAMDAIVALADEDIGEIIYLDDLNRYSDLKEKNQALYNRLAKVTCGAYRPAPKTEKKGLLKSIRSFTQK